MRSTPVVALAFAVSLVVAPRPARALPAFARQTGLQCSACHTQHFPTLNAFGRKFKLDGFTLIGAQAKVEGARLSLPAWLNGALFLKLRFQKTNGVEVPNERTTNSGEIQFPDEFSLFLAGRISNNVGYLLEGSLNGGGPVMAGLKVPFSYDVKGFRALVVPFSTDANGASFGLELLNTGAVYNVRYAEHAQDISAQAYVGTASPASGATFALANQRWFANYTRWAPAHLASSEGRASPLPTSNYARLAWMPQVGGWDLGIGTQRWYGTARVAAEGGGGGEGTRTITMLGTKAWAYDAQAQGRLGKYPLHLYASVARSRGSAVGEAPNAFNAGPRDRRAAAVSSEFGIFPERTSLVLAYRAGDNGSADHSTDRAFTLGTIHHLHQNVQLQVNWTFRSGSAFEPRPTDGNRLLTVMLATAM